MPQLPTEDPHAADNDGGPDVLFTPPLSRMRIQLYLPDAHESDPPHGPARQADAVTVPSSFGKTTGKWVQNSLPQPTTVRIRPHIEQPPPGMLCDGVGSIASLRAGLLNLPATLTDWLTYRISDQLGAEHRSWNTAPTVHVAVSAWWDETAGAEWRIDLHRMRITAFDPAGHAYGSAVNATDPVTGHPRLFRIACPRPAPTPAGAGAVTGDTG